MKQERKDRVEANQVYSFRQQMKRRKENESERDVGHSTTLKHNHITINLHLERETERKCRASKIYQG
jgi:hypothetical protein